MQTRHRVRIRHIVPCQNLTHLAHSLQTVSREFVCGRFDFDIFTIIRDWIFIRRIDTLIIDYLPTCRVAFHLHQVYRELGCLERAGDVAVGGAAGGVQGNPVECSS